MKADAFIQCRVTAETKAALRALAQSQQQTESAVVKRLLEVWLQTTVTPNEHMEVTAAQARRVARLYVRLVPEDRRLLRERANTRGLPASTYVSALVRSHLTGCAPLPKEELRTLKHCVAELGAMGRNLNQIARSANQGARVAGPSREDLRGIVKVCEALRDHVRTLMKANLDSWQTGHGDLSQ